MRQNVPVALTRSEHRRRLRVAYLIWFGVAVIGALIRLPQLAAMGILVLAFWAWHDRRQVIQEGDISPS
jgi:hypothetical protein